MTEVVDFIWSYWFSVFIFMLVYGACRRLDKQDKQIKVLAVVLLRQDTLQQEERTKLEEISTAGRK